jgi:hypothetical protein
MAKAKKEAMMHFGGELMFYRGGHLTVLTGGTKACDPDRKSEHMTTDVVLVTCERCQRQIVRNNQLVQDTALAAEVERMLPGKLRTLTV